MLIDSIALAFETSRALDGFWKKLDEGKDAALGVASSARPLLVAARFAHKPQTTLVVVAGEDAAISFARSLVAYLGEDKVVRFPERSDRPWVGRTADPAVIAHRMEAAYMLASNAPCVVVASARSLVRVMPPVSAHTCNPLSLSLGVDLSAGDVAGLQSFEDCARRLERMGYLNTGELEGPGTFCIRGGTIDLFPGNLIYPVRLDFFGDELDEIRRIVASTGQTVASLSSVTIFPVVEFQAKQSDMVYARAVLEKRSISNAALRETFELYEGGVRADSADILLPYVFEHQATLGDYADSASMTVLVEPRSLFDDIEHAEAELRGYLAGSGIEAEGLLCDPAQISFGSGQRATCVSIMHVGGSVDDSLPVKRVEIAGDEERLFGRLQSLVDADFRVVYTIANHRARESMKLALVDHNLPFEDISNDTRITDESKGPKRQHLRRGIVSIVDIDVPLGMIFPKAQLAIVSLSDLQGSHRVRTVRNIDITEVTFPYKPGDYVVHAAHGVAFFRELVRREVDGTARDYLFLEYAEGDKLYVPIEQLDRVTRYVGPEGASPRLTRLNTSDWSRALGRARKATRKLAFDLVDVYARRAAAKGYCFGVDTPWQREMEEAFPYQETPDQLAAIADVKADMQSVRPMDRLICGDVGFGKTEVALRAAFKACQENKQVMVLCPTTILAQQHYTNFRERFESFGVRVEVLSRFRTSAEQQASLKGFADGEVNVLVGTHRLLSRDVNPRDLGLVIIDEEQRFGVGHKEQLKNLRESTDILTLSATPIPRTLQMSLSGVRDMSLILTPPDDRRSVKVHVGEWDPDLVSAAIRRELARNGQVYYVSNRVRTIDDAVARVGIAAGEARIGVAHGKMSKDELERVMEDFSAGELDVLVATTIIESGIDNPHTNTLIIEDSQRLGLAQMYQLKGRVGRSSTQAYAYFMFPETAALTEEATARLMAIDEYQDLGSGMRIAMRDLEIRGAGSMLGAEQHGNMSAVGFDLFAQMLATALDAAREGDSSSDTGLAPALSDITVNIPGHTYLPEEYICDTDERVLWYRRLASAATQEALDNVVRDLTDQHPSVPAATQNLFAKFRLKVFAAEHGIKTVSVTGGKLLIEPVVVPRKKLVELRRAGGRYVADKRRLTLPVHSLIDSSVDEEQQVLFATVAEFLTHLLGESKEDVTQDAPDATSRVTRVLRCKDASPIAKDAMPATKHKHVSRDTSSKTSCRSADGFAVGLPRRSARCGTSVSEKINKQTDGAESQ